MYIPHHAESQRVIFFRPPQADPHRQHRHLHKHSSSSAPKIYKPLSFQYPYLSQTSHDTKTTTTPGIESQQNHHPNLSLPSITLQTLPHLTDYIPDLPTHTNPLDHNPFDHPFDGFYISPSEVVLRQIIYDLSGVFSISGHHQAYHRAGPRKNIFFDPAQVHAVIVTCGGLCPGMNTVIRELVVGLWELYGVRRISGVLSGYRGFYSSEPVQLNPKLVHNWHRQGGTVLQTSRGGFDLGKIVDAIEACGFNQKSVSMIARIEETYVFGFDARMTERDVAELLEKRWNCDQCCQQIYQD